MSLNVLFEPPTDLAPLSVTTSDDGLGLKINLADGGQVLSVVASGGHYEVKLHMSPNAALFPPTESGHVSAQPG